MTEKRAEKIDRILLKQEKSGISVGEFARSKGLNPKEMYNWRWLRGKQSKSTLPTVVKPIEVSVLKSAPIRSDEKIKLHMKNGLIFESPICTSVTFVAQLVAIETAISCAAAWEPFRFLLLTLSFARFFFAHRVL